PFRPAADGPNMSVRTTPTAAITNSHRTARNASLMMRSVSVLIGSWFLSCDVSAAAVVAENQGRAAERHAGAVGQQPPPHRLAIDEGTVRGPQVDQDNLSVLDPQLGMMP